MKNVEKKNSLRKRIKSFLKSIRIKVKSSRTFIRISKYSLLLVIVFVFSFIISVGSCLFLLSANNPQGEEYLRIATDIYTKEGINANCTQIDENYVDGYIIIYMSLHKKEGEDNKVHLHYTGTLSDECFKKSYMELYSLEDIEIEIPMEKSKTENWYIFDLSGLGNGIHYSEIHISIGKNVFPIKYELIEFEKRFHIHGNSKLNPEAPIQFLFPSDWNVISCVEFSPNTGKHIIVSGERKVLSKAQHPQTMIYYVDLEREFSKVALRDTKIGILISIAFAGIALIISVYYAKRK